MTENLQKIDFVYGRIKESTPSSMDGKRPAPVKVTIGRHGEPYGDDFIPLTADRARIEAQILRGQMLTGINPNLARRKVLREQNVVQVNLKNTLDLQFHLFWMTTSNSALESGRKNHFCSTDTPRIRR